MEKSLRFSIIGAGAIAEKHALAIAAADGAELAAVWARNPATGKAFADERGIEFVADLDELAARADIDCATIATPSGVHAESAMPFLRRGKAVLCEKPLDVTLAKIDGLLDTAKTHEAPFAAILQMRLGKGAQALKRAVAEGRFGRLTLCSAYLKWWRDAAYYESVGWRGTKAFDGGGALMNQGVHVIDMLQWLAGMPSEIFSYSGCLAHSGIEVEDTAVVALKYPDGALGVIEAATSCKPGSATRIELCGDKGSAAIESDRITQWQFDEPLPWDEEIEALRKGGTVTGTSDPRAIGFEGHRLLVEDLVHAVREGRPPLIPAADARNAVQLILAAYESATNGRPVSL